MSSRVAYLVLCGLPGRSAEPLMENGRVLEFWTRREALAAARHMRVLMEGGARCSYRVLKLA
jgi:hypothetical protein